MDKYLLIIEKGVNLGSFTYKIKGEDYYHNTKTLNELVHEIKDIDIKYDLTKPEGDKDRTADSSKANKILSWEQKVPLDNGLERTFVWASDYLKKNR